MPISFHGKNRLLQNIYTVTQYSQRKFRFQNSNKLEQYKSLRPIFYGFIHAAYPEIDSTKTFTGEEYTFHNAPTFLRLITF